jgi:protein TonB
MLLASGHSWQQEGGFARWSGALATVLALHAGAALSGLVVWSPSEPPAPPPAAIMLELTPVPAAPPAPHVTAPPEPTPPPAPEVDLTRLLPPIPELPLIPPGIPKPEVVLPKPEPEKKKAEQAKPDKPKEKPKKDKVEKPKPKPEPEPDVAQEPALEPAQQQAAKAAAPVPPSVAPAAPSAADVARVANAKVTWQGMLEAHLRKFRKYPRSALRRNIEGTVLVRFRMDRDGEVLSYSVVRSSDHDVLDEAALDMIERADPLPPLPDEVPGESIEIIIPATFDITEP